MFNDCQSYWTGDHGIRMITPQGPESSPDPSDIRFVQQMAVGHLCDYGCGTGRWSMYFKSSQYVGVDINPAAVEKARTIHPDHEFRVVEYLGNEPPTAETYLLYTVVLHIPDDVVDQFLAQFDNRVIIAECMDPSKRNSPFNSQREKGYYISTMKYLGFKLVSLMDDKYRPFTVLVFDKGAR